MSKKNALDIHDENALGAMLLKKKEELAALHFQVAHKALKKVDQIKKVRKTIARIMTALHQQT